MGALANAAILILEKEGRACQLDTPPTQTRDSCSCGLFQVASGFPPLVKVRRELLLAPVWGDAEFADYGEDVRQFQAVK